MGFEGCQGKKDIEIMEKPCPRCGNEIEIFSIDISAKCDVCGFEIYNDGLSCVQWCKYARKCMGDDLYEHLMAVAESQKIRAAATEEKTE